MDVVTLSVGAGLGVAASAALGRLREHRAAPQGAADLLNWGFVVDAGAPAVILQKDGSLLAGWRYRGPDLFAATPEELDALTRHANDALLPFSDNWMFHVDAIRRPAIPYSPDVFPDAVCQLIDDERRLAHEQETGRQFETTYTIVATYLPPSDTVARLASFFVQDVSHGLAPKGSARSGSDTVWDRVLGAYRTAVHTLQTRLGGRLVLEPLDADGLLTHLHECLTGLPQAVRTPLHGSYLDLVLADQELVSGFEPSIGRHAIRVVAIQGFPDRSQPGQLDILNSVGFPYRWSTRFIPLGTHEASRLIRRHQLQWFKKRKGAAAWAKEMVGGGRNDRPPDPDDALWQDQDARAMAQDASDAAAENARGEVRFCFLTQVAVVMDADASRADHAAGELLKIFTDRGFTGRVETVNALEAYLGSLPGHGYPNLRRPVLSTQNIADLLPLTSTWSGLAHNPSPYFPPASPPLLWAKTAGSTPFRLNLHDSDVGHTLVFGPTGAGKSVLLGFLAAQFRRYPDAQVFVFDVGYSMWTLSSAAGAKHYDLAAGRPDALRFQPLAALDEPTERAWAAEWLETVVALQGVTVTPPLRARVDRALELVARNDRAHRTVTELTVQLQHEDLAAALRPYTVMGHYGELLDAATDDLCEGAYQVFELKHLLALDDRVALPVLLYLFRRIERRLDGRPTLIAIDEAWLALMHSLFGARINQWLLTLRKQNAAVVLATQSPAQLAQLPFRSTILDSCPTKLYLANPDAATPAQAPLYRELGLNAREVSLIAQAVPKRHYYFKSPRGSRLFELGLGPAALAFLAGLPGATIDETRRAVEALAKTHESAWPIAWLDSLGHARWAEHLRALMAARAAPTDAPAPNPALASHFLTTGGSYEEGTL